VTMAIPDEEGEGRGRKGRDKKQTDGEGGSAADDISTISGIYLYCAAQTDYVLSQSDRVVVVDG